MILDSQLIDVELDFGAGGGPNDSQQSDIVKFGELLKGSGSQYVSVVAVVTEAFAGPTGGDTVTVTVEQAEDEVFTGGDLVALVSASTTQTLGVLGKVILDAKVKVKNAYGRFDVTAVNGAGDFTAGKVMLRLGHEEPDRVV